MTPAKSRSFSIEAQPEVFFSTAETSRAVSYAARKGRVRRIVRGLYTRERAGPIEDVVRRNAWRIAAGYFPGAVVGDRTALELEPGEDGIVTLVADRSRDVRLPGLWLRAREGAGPIEGDLPWMGEDLYMSSRARAFLENMRASRRRSGPARTLTRAEVEEKLDEHAGSRQERLNELRDEARKLASALDAAQELERLDRLIGAIQGTRTGELRSARGRARRQGTPYDEHRVVRFGELHRHLISTAVPSREAEPGHEPSTFAFFEAYFSNFIEGTEFEVDEAARIVFEGLVPAQRPQDAHDILGTYRLVADPRERERVPASAGELIDILQGQHAVLLAGREGAGAGEFKRAPNRAGGTHFVAPEHVEGTLREGWRFYESLPRGFARCAFAMFLVSEVHPFADGNGRMARVLMNAELTAAGQQRIVVPVASRGDYLSALRAMTHNALAATYVSVLGALQQLTQEVDFSSRTAAELDLRRRGAFDDPGAQPGMLGQVLRRAE